MLPQNKTAFEKCNILQWQADNQGELATIAVIDRGDMVFDYLKENTIIPFKMKESTTDHGTSVIAVGREIAKKARVIMLAFDKHNQKQECIDYIKKHAGGIDVINVSYSTNIVTARKYFDQLKDLDIPIICAAGNDGKDKISYPARFDYTIAVGADKYYSNAGEELDCLAPTNIYYLNSRGEPVFFTGTSCAAPFVSFALALYITWRKKNGLPRLGREEIREFIHDNCEDMYEEGHDPRSGYGLFRLPDTMLEVITTNKPEYIIIHHSATSEGDAEAFRKAHKAKGWRDIGYHYVINNGTYQPDGLIETGRTEYEDGAHCKADGMNFRSIGICLVGDFDKTKPTSAQMEALERLCKDIMARHKIPSSKVLGHGEAAATNCPGKNFDMTAFRKRLEEKKVEKKDYEGHWAQQYIEKAVNAGYMAGYPDGSFKPDNPITRAEFARVLSFIIDKVERR